MNAKRLRMSRNDILMLPASKGKSDALTASCIKQLPARAAIFSAFTQLF